VLQAASGHLQKSIQARIQVQGVPVSRRSLPGEAPRKETEDLYKSWTYTVNPPAGYSLVYSPLDYAFYLEVGARATFGYIDARPYIVRTLFAEESTLLSLMTSRL
jgi:hypothetical protein